MTRFAPAANKAPALAAADKSAQRRVKSWQSRQHDQRGCCDDV